MHLKGPGVCLFYSCHSEECKSFWRSFVKSASPSASLGYSGASQVALGSYIQTADQTPREDFNSGFRHLDLVNGGLVDTVKGRHIIPK